MTKKVRLASISDPRGEDWGFALYYAPGDGKWIISSNGGIACTSENIAEGQEELAAKAEEIIASGAGVRLAHYFPTYHPDEAHRLMIEWGWLESPTVPPSPLSPLEAAYECYARRQSRHEHPDGKFDKQGRWYPSKEEYQDCCSSIRSPSRSFPYSMLTHCRSMEHVANLFGVPVAELRARARKASPPEREGGEEYFKAVALVEGRLLSIFDGETEYKLGETVAERARRDHEGGYYVYASLAEAKQADVPSESALIAAPRVIVRVRAEGQYCRYGQKLAFSRITPLEIVAS